MFHYGMALVADEFYFLKRSVYIIAYLSSFTTIKSK